MAGGWSKDGGVQDQIDASVDDAVRQARENLPAGESAVQCEHCDVAILERRRKAVPGVKLCVNCQQLQDEESRLHSTINRRGSKDSQLR